MAAVVAIPVWTMPKVRRGSIRGSMAMKSTSTASRGRRRGSSTRPNMVRVKIPVTPEVAMPAKMAPKRIVSRVLRPISFW